MLIVDAQVHIWSAGPPTNPSHRQVTSYTAEECIRDMDAAGVNGCLLHPPGWDPNSGKISEEAAAKYPNRFAILGNFPLDKPENRSLIDTCKSRPGMLGLRYAFTQPHQANWMTDGTMDWLWPAVEKAGIPIALMASNYLPQVAQIAERHPGLKLLIDHYARVRDGKDDAAHGNQTALLALAKHPNVAVKCTGAILSLSQYSQIHPADRRDLRAAAQLLGHRHHPHAVFVEAMRDDVHRGDAVAQRPRPRAGDGPRGLRLGRLETIRLIERKSDSARAPAKPSRRG